LKELQIPLPPLDQQKKIAAILDAADAYRQKTKALIEKYDELTQSLFLDMFGDPVSNPKGWLQNQFAERVKAIEEQKAQAQASLAQAEDLFNSLLQRAFKGELTS
jgi:restriction endonuclease S subunit